MFGKGPGDTILSLRKKDLEIWLEHIPPHKNPDPRLEQYSTPATVAADILFTAYTFDDIYQKKIADLGCGTGIFAIGAAYIGAEKAYGVDIDDDSISSAKKTADKLGLSERCQFTVSPIETFNQKADTVIMNPPFGSQSKGADIPFLENAFQVAPRVYTLHNAKGEEYVRGHIQGSGYRILGEKRYMFPVNRTFSFHRKKRKEFETVLLICERN
ncbi:MAG: METTL5 family protein [Thermoplasmata archaeon]